MNRWTARPSRHSSLAPIVLGVALLFLDICFGANAGAQSATVRGAHEGMAPGEKTDDLGITVPMAPVDFPARRYPASHEFPTGPAIGDRLPEFALSNQNGEPIDFHKSRGNAKAIVVFYRSAVW